MNKTAGIAAAIIVLIVYILTLAPSVYFIDSGELSAVASTLGIAHPTGYPLFTIIGHLFTLLPLPGDEVYKLNLMSALFCAAGIYIFYNSLIYFSRLNFRGIKKKKSGKPSNSDDGKILIPENAVYIIAAFAVLVLGFSRTYWSLANSVEVYSIHAFFVITLIFVFIKAVTTKSDTGGSFIRQNIYYLAFAFLTGLSFTNHMTTILLAPACLFLFIIINYKDKNRLIKLFLYMTPFFITGLSLYLYLPLRANANPMFNWGNPYNYERFIWHVTGKQFSVWLFSTPGSLALFMIFIIILLALSIYGFQKRDKISNTYHIGVFAGFFILSGLILLGNSEVVEKQFTRFISSLTTEFGPGIFLLGLIGVYRLLRSDLRLYYFTLLLFFGNILYAVNYDIHDIDSYFILAYITAAIWIFYGAIFAYEIIIESAKSSVRAAVPYIIVLIAIVPLITHYEFNDESSNYLVEEFTMNVFKNIEPNGIIISSQWDFWLSASWYYNHVKNIRKDIVVIDKELLRRSWYYKYIQNHYPEVYERSRPEIERFMPELDKFEHGLPYDTKTIGKLFTDVITSFVAKNPERYVYTTWEIEQNQQEPFAQNYARVPDGLLFRLVSADAQNVMLDIKTYDFKFTPTTEKGYYHETIMNSYNMMLTNSAYYLMQQNKKDEAKKYLDLALTAIPNSPKSHELKRMFNL